MSVHCLLTHTQRERERGIVEIHNRDTRNVQDKSQVKKVMFLWVAEYRNIHVRTYVRVCVCVCTAIHRVMYIMLTLVLSV